MIKSLFSSPDPKILKFQNDINFYGINILDYSNITKETFRIIKYNLDKIGNKIEANKYHALELHQNRKDIWADEKINFDLLQRGLISLFHYISSNHSQSWILSLIWIFVIGLTTYMYLYNISLFEISKIDINIAFQYISILTKKNEFCDNKNIAFVLNKAFLSYMYYQFLISIRKDTKK